MRCPKCQTEMAKMHTKKKLIYECPECGYRTDADEEQINAEAFTKAYLARAGKGRK